MRPEESSFYGIPPFTQSLNSSTTWLFGKLYLPKHCIPILTIHNTGPSGLETFVDSTPPEFSSASSSFADCFQNFYETPWNSSVGVLGKWVRQLFSENPEINRNKPVLTFNIDFYVYRYEDYFLANFLRRDLKKKTQNPKIWCLHIHHHESCLNIPVLV